MKSVVQDWLLELPFRQQSVVLCALRGCDGIPKDDPSKALVRYYRGCVLNNAFNIGDPERGTFIQRMPTPKQVDEVFGYPDHYPLHWYGHFMHGAEILGYFHPEPGVARFWNGVYAAACNALHLGVLV